MSTKDVTFVGKNGRSRKFMDLNHTLRYREYYVTLLRYVLEYTRRVLEYTKCIGEIYTKTAILIFYLFYCFVLKLDKKYNKKAHFFSLNQ